MLIAAVSARPEIEATCKGSNTSTHIGENLFRDRTFTCKADRKDFVARAEISIEVASSSEAIAGRSWAATGTVWLQDSHKQNTKRLSWTTENIPPDHHMSRG